MESLTQDQAVAWEKRLRREGAVVDVQLYAEDEPMRFLCYEVFVWPAADGHPAGFAFVMPDYSADPFYNWASWHAHEGGAEADPDADVPTLIAWQPGGWSRVTVRPAPAVLNDDDLDTMQAERHYHVSLMDEGHLARINAAISDFTQHFREAFGYSGQAPTLDALPERRP